MKTPHEHESRRSVAITALLAAFLLAGCWQMREGPAPPDLTAQSAEVDQTVARLGAIDASMRREIEQLRSNSAAFFDEPPATWGDPFPLDVFKHTAMSCLNAPYTETEPAPVVRDVAIAFGVACAVPAAVDLADELDETPRKREFATRKLRQVDEMRRIRATLQGRLRQLPSIVRRTRNYLATRRAEARKMDKEIRRRQPEYSRKRFDEALERVEAYRERLDHLEETIRLVEESTHQWATELGEVVNLLYEKLSQLGTN